MSYSLQAVDAQRVGINDFSAQACGKHVTVYGWSRSLPGTERWVVAEQLGEALAKRGFGIVSGGYCGSMEAVSKGARHAVPDDLQSTTPPKPFPPTLDTQHHAGTSSSRGVAVRGILVPGAFPDRTLVGNPYLTESADARNMPHRLDLLSSLTRYYVALPGTLGTLTEICNVWCLASIHKQSLPRPVLLLWRQPWEAALRSVVEATEIPLEHWQELRFVDTVDECVAAIEADYAQQTQLA